MYLTSTSRTGLEPGSSEGPSSSAAGLPKGSPALEPVTCACYQDLMAWAWIVGPEFSWRETHQRAAHRAGENFRFHHGQTGED